MRLKDVKQICDGMRRRAPRGNPEFFETCCVRLNATDLHNIAMIKRAIDSKCTDSELMRAIIRAASVDLLGSYDDATIEVDRRGNGVVFITSRRTGAGDRTGDAANQRTR